MNRVQVVLSGFSVRLLCFVQAKTVCMYGCMYFLAALVLVCVDVMARIVHTGVPQGSKLSSLLFSFYLAHMPRPTEPVKRICYVGDITVWASGVKIPELEHTVKLIWRRCPVSYCQLWSTNASESNIGKIQRAQNKELRTITGSHKMSSIDRIHSETEVL